MKEAFVQVSGLLLEVGVGFTTIFLFKLAIVSKSALGRFAGKLDAGTRGITNKAKEFGEGRNFYQRRQFARDARKQEQRRANVADYAEQITGDSWRSRQLRRRAAGGMIGQVVNNNQAGQQRQYAGGVAQLGKLEHEETAQGSMLIEHARISTPSELAAIAGGGVGTGIDGATVSGANNRAVQVAAINKIIKAQDAEQIEAMFENPSVDKNMLVSELKKEQNYSTSKGAGAHFVSMDPRTYSRSEINNQALISMSNIAAEKLAAQDGPAWKSAAAGYAAGAGTIEQRRKMWDQVQAIYNDPQIRNKLKPSSQPHFEAIRTVPRP